MDLRDQSREAAAPNRATRLLKHPVSRLLGHGDRPLGRDKRLIVTTSLVDAVGSGLFAGLSSVFLLTVVHLTPAQVGLGLSVAGAVGFAGTLPLGVLGRSMGVRPLLIALFVLQAALFVGYAFITTFWAFLLLASIIVLAERATGPLRRALSAELFGVAASIPLQAYLRATTNAGWTLGALLGTLPLALGHAWAFQVALLVNAASFAIGAALTLRISRPAAPPPDSRPPPWGVLKDARYTAMTVVVGLLGLYDVLLTVGFPVFVVTHTAAPRVVITAALVINTAASVLLQVRFSRNATTLGGGIRVIRFSALMTAAGVLVIEVAGYVSVPWSVVWLLVAASALTVAELWHSAAGWSFSYQLAPPGAHSTYQAAFSLGRTLELTLAPTLVTFAFGRGLAWVAAILVAPVLLLGLIVGPVINWAAGSPLRHA